MKTEQKMSRLFIELPPDKHRQLRIIAATEGKTMKEIIIECIEAKSNRFSAVSSPRPQPRTEG